MKNLKWQRLQTGIIGVAYDMPFSCCSKNLNCLLCKIMHKWQSVVYTCIISYISFVPRLHLVVKYSLGKSGDEPNTGFPFLVPILFPVPCFSSCLISSTISGCLLVYQSKPCLSQCRKLGEEQREKRGALLPCNFLHGSSLIEVMFIGEDFAQYTTCTANPL